MNNIDRKNKINKKIKTIFSLIIVIICIIYYFYVENNKKEEIIYTNDDEKNVISNKEEYIEENESELNEIEEIKKTKLIIHIAGAVINQGIVEVEEGSRISDVIEKAGGLKENANLININLAMKVEDGMKIYISSNDEINSQEVKVNLGLQSENFEDYEINKNEKININTASVNELDELPGIGEATATKIIKYREENGEFKSIEDIKNVSGIGDSKYDEIKDKIEI